MTSFSGGRVAELRNGGAVLTVRAQLETLTEVEFEHLGKFLNRGIWESSPPRILRYGNELGYLFADERRRREAL
ncbi:MAG: hypothetical protein ABSC51_12205 [Gaiellaceae bacterium]